MLSQDVITFILKDTFFFVSKILLFRLIKNNFKNNFLKIEYSILMEYFRFPTKNPKLLKQWIEAIGKKNWQPSTASRVCHYHFQVSDFLDELNMKRKLLKKDAIPSVNLVHNNNANNTLNNPLQDLTDMIEMRKYISIKM